MSTDPALKPKPKPKPKPVVSINPYDIEVAPTPAGIVVTAHTTDTTYRIDLPWNGWVSVLLKALAEAVAAKLNPPH